MSRILDRLQELASPLPPRAGTLPRPANLFTARRQGRPFVLGGLLLACGALAFFTFRKPSPPPMAVDPAAAEAQVLFLRNREAVWSFYAGQLDRAAREMGALAAERPQAAVLQANLGGVLLARGATDEAKAAYGRALRLDPKLPSALYGLGQIALRAHDLAGAEEKFRSLLTVAPNRAEAHLSLGQVSELRGQWASARAHYERFLAVAGENALKGPIAHRLQQIGERADPAPARVPSGEAP